MTARTAPVAPTPLRRNRAFSLLWFGEGVSVLGSMTGTVVLPLLAIEHFNATPFQMGLLTAAVWLPWLLLGLVVGALVDRFDNRRVMIGADVASAAALATIPIGSRIGVLGIGQLLAVALVTGTCTVFFRTAYAGLIPRVVPDEHLDGANARLVGTESAMQVAGPGIGGALVGLVGAIGAVFAQTATFLVSALCLCAIGSSRTSTVPSSPPPRHAAREILTEVQEGIRVTAGDPFMRLFALTGGISNLGLTGYQGLLVLFMVRDLHLGPGAIGQLMSLGAVGGVLGAVIAPGLARRWGTARAIILLIVPTGPAALLIAAAGPGGHAWPLAVGPFLVGVGVVGANAIRTAWRQRYTPEELLGRTIGATAVLNFGLMPLGGVLAGWLGGQVGLRPAIAVMATIHLLGTLVNLAPPLRARRDLPTRMSA